MKGVGTDIGTIHFVGIGGIGMSGIAEVMHNLGYSVQGSDIAEGYVVEGLRKRGIKVDDRPRRRNLGDAAVVVTSTAVKRDNPEVAAALEQRIPVVRRAEMLAELMRLKRTVAVAGTHGKTTTTSMVAALLDAGGIDPTVINGGIINSYGSNARLGASEWMVVEADESDGSFLRLDGTIAVVTNIDPEHLDHYGSFDAVKEAFVEFIENVPFYGAAVLCIDHPEVQAVIAQGARPPGDHLRLLRPGRRARRERHARCRAATASTWSLRQRDGDRPHGSRASSCRCPAATTSRTRSPRSRWRSRWAAPTSAIRTGFAQVRRGRAALHQGRRSRRRDGDRRLRPPPGRDPRGARRRARRRAGPGDRGRPAAPLHPPARPDGRVPGRLQRRRRGLSSRRSIRRASSRSRASIPRRWSQGLQGRAATARRT